MSLPAPEDPRTYEEIQQDNFLIFARTAPVGSRATIVFADDQYYVELKSRQTQQPEFVSLRVIGEKHGLEGPNLAFTLSDEHNEVKLISQD